MFVETNFHVRELQDDAIEEGYLLSENLSLLEW